MRGVFIAVEGTDGSGKATQTKMLAKRLKNQGYDVHEMAFPRYEQPSSYFVKEYLNGSFGSSEAVGPYSASYFYALDRYAASQEISEALSLGKIVVCDRYTASNMAHQGAKFKNRAIRQAFYHWTDRLEFKVLQIPRPDINLVLSVPAATAQEMVDKKQARAYTSKKRDLHEADLMHLKRSEMAYNELCKLFKDNFLKVNCTKDGKLLGVASIHNLIWQKTIEQLSKIRGEEERKMEKLDNPYVEQTDGGLQITEAGKQWLGRAVTDLTDQTYAIKGKADPQQIGAAMARLSRRNDDLRLILADEFAAEAGREEGVLRRVISEYGDDSVQQLSAIPLVAEKSSNVLSKKLEWGRLAAYLETSSRYIMFDKKDSDGRYKYHRPEHFNVETRLRYESDMDSLFDNYAVVVKSLETFITGHDKTPKAERDAPWRSAVRAQACDAARAMLPASTESTIGMLLSPQALEQLYMRLSADELPEANQRAAAILKAGRAVVPMFLERADLPNRGRATIEYLAGTKTGVGELIQEMLKLGEANEEVQPGAQLVSYTPKNEMDILADIVYEHSQQSRQEIEAQLASLSYGEKEKLMEAYFGKRANRRHKPGRALENIHYSWDIVSDYGIFRDLQRHRMVDDLKWQRLTPHLGYEVPKIVEDAALDGVFNQNFEISASLFEFLRAKGYQAEAQYATLMGHNMRWSLTYNAREAFHIHELRTSPQGHPNYRKLINAMHEQVCEVHPLIGRAMIFVNQEDDPNLTRLEAERRAHRKINKPT